jgi:general secretion pathway protein C
VFEQLNTFTGKLPHQKLSKIVAITLLVYCAYLLADLTWRFVPTTSDHGTVSIQPSIAVVNSSVRNNINLNDLLSTNLFGDLKKKAIDKPAPKIDQSAPKTRLNVRLTGLVADSSNVTSATSVAIIESAGSQDTYGIDEKINGTSASVHQILIDRVLLYVSGRYETLMLEGIEYSTTVPGSDNKADHQKDKQTVKKDNAPSNDKPMKKERLDKRGDIELSQSLREQREKLFDDPKNLIDVIRVRPYRKSGELKGYKLSPGKDGKLFTEIGLKRNDLATSINGYDLTDMQQSLTVMKELSSMTEATITVVRNDTEIDIILAL